MVGGTGGAGGVLVVGSLGGKRRSRKGSQASKGKERVNSFRRALGYCR